MTFLVPVHAQTYPNYQDLYVNDFGAILSSEDETKIRAKLRVLRQADGIEFTVVTITSMQGMGHSGAIEPFATGLFNYWGIGDANRNDGVLLLVSREDRALRIELGAGYGRSKDAEMKRIVDTVIVPEFRRDDYGAGISHGVDAVITEITGRAPVGLPPDAPVFIRNPIQRFLDWIGAWIYAAVAPVLAGAGFLFRRWQRNSPRRCPNDGSRMQKLAEHWDDRHLQEGQIAEEKVKSIDYDVWQCAQCDHLTIEAYKSWFSRYSACRSCGFKTVQASTILVSPTTASTGKKRVDYICHNCSDVWSATRIIPRVSKSSSSSGSSSGGFGGGSSGGGGASGSW